MDNLRALATDLHRRIDKWIISNNKKIVVDDSTNASKKEVVSKWDVFLDKAWRTREVTASFCQGFLPENCMYFELFQVPIWIVCG